MIIDHNIEKDLNIENEIHRKERDAFFNAYESEWLKVFQTESGPKNFDYDTSTYIFCCFFLFLFFFHFMLVVQTNLYYQQFLQVKGGIDNLPRCAQILVILSLNKIFLGGLVG